jgi:preprotein translocase subunit Sec63
MLWFALYALQMAAVAALVFSVLTREGGAKGEGGGSGEDAAQFDPYAILGIEPDAAESDVHNANRA